MCETLSCAPWPKGAVRWPRKSAPQRLLDTTFPFFAHARRHSLFLEPGNASLVQP